MNLATAPTEVTCKNPGCEMVTRLDEDQQTALERGECAMITCTGCGSVVTVCHHDSPVPCTHVGSAYVPVIELVSACLADGISTR